MSLRVGIVQYNIAWKDKQANFKKVTEMLTTVDADLIVLPEMFQTGFCVEDASQAEGASGETMSFLNELSVAKQCTITGSFMCNVKGKIVNRFVAVDKGEIIHYYDKIHLFAMGGEDSYITSGDGIADFSVNGFRIRPLICYDLRFPYVSFNTSNYDVLLYVANWPSQRIAHWDTLLQARAIENQAYVVACNRVGEQDGHFYPGHSSVYSPKGEQVAKGIGEEVIELLLEKAEIETTRTKLPFLKDQMKM